MLLQHLHSRHPWRSDSSNADSIAVVIARQDGLLLAIVALCVFTYGLTVSFRTHLFQLGFLCTCNPNPSAVKPIFLVQKYQYRSKGLRDNRVIDRACMPRCQTNILSQFDNDLPRFRIVATDQNVASVFAQIIAPQMSGRNVLKRRHYSHIFSEAFLRRLRHRSAGRQLNPHHFWRHERRRGIDEYFSLHAVSDRIDNLVMTGEWHGHDDHLGARRSLRIRGRLNAGARSIGQQCLSCAMRFVG